jgi:hypothetical protein
MIMNIFTRMTVVPNIGVLHEKVLSVKDFKERGHKSVSQSKQENVISQSTLCVKVIFLFQKAVHQNWNHDCIDHLGKDRLYRI